MIILKLKLLWLFGVFLTTLALEAFSTIRTLVFYAGLTATVFWIFITNLTTASTESPSILYPAIDPHSPPEQTLQIDEATARALLTQYLEILAVQPNHRDILLNAAQLHLALGEIEQGRHLREQARLLDPNHPTFLE